MDVFTTQKDIRKKEREEKLRLYREKVANRDSSDIYDFSPSDSEENHSSDILVISKLRKKNQKKTLQARRN